MVDDFSKPFHNHSMPGFRASISLLRLVTLVSALTAQACAGDAQTLQLVPARLQLAGPEAPHRVLALLSLNGDVVGEAPAAVELSSSDDNVVLVDGSTLIPRGNGAATVTGQWDGQTATCQVTVSGMDQPHAWSFRNHVQPILARYGCNAGSCHGALAGKGGFKLSLRGYDTVRDHYWITRQARGRRVELGDPGRSLLLAKPTVAIPHKGGLRFDVDSRPYRVLSAWIAAGVAPPRDEDPRIDRLEVLPERMILSPGQSLSLLVRAHYDDGRSEDVTEWAKFRTVDEAVAKVDELGRTQVVGHGQGSVTAWFAQQIVVATITVPYPNSPDENVFTGSPSRNFIDDCVLEKLAQLRLPPSGQCTDPAFVRRAYIDTIGMLPTRDEVRIFLDDASADKRDRLIDQLLAREEFVDYWTYKWSDVFLVGRRKIPGGAVNPYYQWLRKHVADNTAWDAVVREVLTAKGDAHEQGEVNFYSSNQSPEALSESASQAFMGLSIGCAKCHNHPLEKWTNDQYYAMANMFARVRAKGWGGRADNGDGKRFVFVADTGDLIQPSSGRPQAPAPLDAAPLPFNAQDDRREYLAEWMTSPDNPYFARAAANRIWANFFGVGIVEPVDDLRLTNPPSNARLMRETAQYLVDHDFDLKALMRAILQSETYQRTSLPLAENAADRRFFSRYYPRRLMAEVLLDAIVQAAGTSSTFTHVRKFDGKRDEVKDYPEGTRAVELKDSAVESYFLDAFGRNDREIICECERFSAPTMVQVLHLSNGDTINHALAAENNRISESLNANKDDRQLITEIFLTALARGPTEIELDSLLAELTAAPDADRRILIEDLFWGVLSSREFLFNH